MIYVLIIAVIFSFMCYRNNRSDIERCITGILLIIFSMAIYLLCLNFGAYLFSKDNFYILVGAISAFMVTISKYLFSEYPRIWYPLLMSVSFGWGAYFICIIFNKADLVRAFAGLSIGCFVWFVELLTKLIAKRITSRRR